jgi:CheY-like chemotaxis protein
MREDAGWQFLQKLKMTPETAKIPLIICTTNQRIVQEMEGHLANKGVLVVFKPFELDELLEAVNKLIGSADDKNGGTTDINPQTSPGDVRERKKS